MASITINRHPATIYYFLSHHFMDRGITADLWIYGHRVCPENSWTIGGQTMLRVKGDGPYEQDITIESFDEDLLAWVALAMPERWTT